VAYRISVLSCAVRAAADSCEERLARIDPLPANTVAVDLTGTSHLWEAKPRW